MLSLSIYHTGNVNVVRIQIHTLIITEEIKYNKIIFLFLEKKKIEKIILIKIIMAYSAIKIKANITLPYSILKPETNSDSPSAKSKGVRLVSAIHEINQIPTIGKKIIILFQ